MNILGSVPINNDTIEKEERKEEWREGCRFRVIE
jgi:hypothetical protein